MTHSFDVWEEAELRAQLRIAKERADALAARLKAWEDAADDFMVVNWIGVYDREDEPKRTFAYCIEHCLDQERDALRTERDALAAELDTFAASVTLAAHGTQSDHEHRWAIVRYVRALCETRDALAAELHQMSLSNLANYRRAEELAAELATAKERVEFEFNRAEHHLAWVRDVQREHDKTAAELAALRAGQAPKKEPENKHVCGLQGYNPMIDPMCPGCEAEARKYRRQP